VISLKTLKYSRIVVSLYNWILDFRCRHVESYVFVATTGRSGSGSLSRIFEAVDGAVCLHEPYPIMLNDAPERISRDEYFNDLFNKKKRINVKRSAVGYKCYVETNHQFVKNFIKPAIECFGQKIKIVHLIRDPIKTAASFYAINTIPGKSERAKQYLIDPKDPDNIIKLPDLYNGNQEFLHDFFKCLWYWYEVEARIEKLKSEHPDLKWHTIHTTDLNSFEAVAEMLKEFNLQFDYQNLRTLIGIRDNTKINEKVNKIDHSECLDKHDKFVTLIRKKYNTKIPIKLSPYK